MGRPVQSDKGPLAGWSEDDLAIFIQRYLDKAPAEFNSPFLQTKTMKIAGDLTLAPDTSINYRPMDSPTLVAGASGPGYQNSCADSGTSGVSKVMYFKDPHGWTHLRGTVRVPAASLASTFFQLPPGFRPDKTVTAVVGVFDVVAVAWLSTRALQIDSTGAVQLQNTTGTNACDVHLDNIRFPITTNN